MPPLVMGRDTPLKYCFEQSPKYADGYKAAAELRAMYDTDPDVKRVVDVAKGLEGPEAQRRHPRRRRGDHQGAAHRLPADPAQARGRAATRADAPVVTQYEMHGVEELGLLKMDFLGLRNLDVITDTVAMVRATQDPDVRHRRRPARRPADVRAARPRRHDRACSSWSRRRCARCCRSLAPTSFDDVAALIALYRPGPMSANMHYDYADRKNGRKPVEYFHADAEEVLGDTYGLMIYQESVMRVAQKFAGYSLAEADNLRKAMGKKIREVMAKERETFEAGCDAHRLRRDARQAAVRHHRAFADYAFNKSHTFGYGLVTYQTAYLKAHYPVEYFACLLTSVKGNLDKAAVYLADCRAMGIKVLTPDVNRSVIDFAALAPDRGARRRRRCRAGSPGAITFGLSAVRNVGEGLVELLLAERDENGPFDVVPRLRRAGARAGAQQAHGRVADQGRRVRLARPSAAGPADGLRADHRRARSSAAASATRA